MKTSIPRWSKEELFANCDEYYASVLRDIDNAKVSIDVEMYIFRIDLIGRPIAEALLGAASRGVRVRLLVDSIGTGAAAFEVAKYFERTMVELRFYRRFFAYGWLPSPWRLNRRNHRKAWIFDSVAAYVGSANVDQCHLSRVRGGSGWRDMSLRFEGPEIEMLVKAFEAAWTKPNLLPAKTKRIRLRDLIRKREGHENDLIHLNDTFWRRRIQRHENRKRLMKAKERVWLGNAYFAPHHSFVSLLRKLARRGVDVRVLVPRHSDIFFMPLITFSYYQLLLESGVKLYEYLPGVYHAKVYVIDDYMTVGSSNLDYRSVLYNLEVDVCVRQSETMLALTQSLEEDFLNSEQITLKMIRAKPWYLRFFARILSLFRYWV